MPWACRSPRKLSFQPENGKNATGAATPMFTPTMPASTSCLKRRTAAPDSVKIDTPLPKREPFTASIASSSVSTWISDSTGPKISSRATSMSGPHAVEHRRADERALGNLGVTAVHEQLRALADASLDCREDALARRLGDDGLGALVEAVAHAHGLGGLLQRGQQALVRVADGHDHADRPCSAGRPRRTLSR